MANENKKDLFEDNTSVDENDVDIITLRNIEKDKDEDFYHLATYDLNDQWYIALLPVKPEKGEEDDVYIFRVEEQKGENFIIPIEDEAELDAAFEEFQKFMDENAGDEEK